MELKFHAVMKTLRGAHCFHRIMKVENKISIFIYISRGQNSLSANEDSCSINFISGEDSGNYKYCIIMNMICISFQNHEYAV